MQHLSPTLSVLLALSLSALADESLSLTALPSALRDTSGFCVQIGCGDGALTTSLASNDRLVTHALDGDPAVVDRLRSQLQSRNLYGQAVVEHWPASWLPYPDNLVNVIVASSNSSVSAKEMLRALVPNGVVYIIDRASVRVLRKTWPREFDEWTHWRHGADGNMVSRDTALETPTGLRWVAGPVQDDGGRKWYYDHVLITSAGRNFYVFDDSIVARDSFNGRLLWRRNAKATIFKENGTPFPAGVASPKMKAGTRTSKVRPVAIGNRLYAAIDGELVVLDAAAGKTLKPIAKLDTPREIAVDGKIIVVSDKNGVRGFTVDGNAQWKWEGFARRFVTGDGKVFCITGDEVACLDLASGKERWRARHQRVTESLTCSYGCGVLALECSALRDDGDGSGLIVFDGKDGALLWRHDFTPGMTHYKEARSFFSSGLLWVQEQVSKKPQVVKFLGLDPRTGQQQKDVGTRGLHCAAPVATERFFIAPEMEFTDVKTGEQTRARMTRHSCRMSFVPANGLLYTYPVQCECFPMLRGYMALGQTPPERDAGLPRLQRGPAFAGYTAAEPKSDEWPMYRHDAFRSGSTSTEIPADAKTLWTVQVTQPTTGNAADDWRDNPFVRGALSAPVCAAGTLLMAEPDRHCVVALDSATGTTRWKFTAGGRVDTPPTITGNRCVFGAHDGYVYCVDIRDGRLAWRFRAAPYEARIAVHGQMESPWPVAGSVLVENGTAYFAAGRQEACDGGVHACAVRVKDGELVWEKVVTDLGMKNFYSAYFPKSKRKIGYDYEPVDIFARDGNCVAMSRWRFNPDNGEMLFTLSSTNYIAFSNVEVPRGVWGFGIRQTKNVFDKPAAAFDSQKVVIGSTNDVAMVLAGAAQITGNATGVLKFPDKRTSSLGSPLLREGLIAANGRLYAATRDGKIVCLGQR